MTSSRTGSSRGATPAERLNAFTSHGPDQIRQAQPKPDDFKLQSTFHGLGSRHVTVKAEYEERDFLHHHGGNATPWQVEKPVPRVQRLARKGGPRPASESHEQQEAALRKTQARETLKREKRKDLLEKQRQYNILTGELVVPQEKAQEAPTTQRGRRHFKPRDEERLEAENARLAKEEASRQRRQKVLLGHGLNQQPRSSVADVFTPLESDTR